MRNRLAPSILLALFATALAAQALPLSRALRGPQALRRPPSPRALTIQAECQSLLDALHKSGDFPGASLSLILPDGREVHCVTGVADASAETPMPKQPRMMSGSVGKTFVAAAIALLAERGSLAWDDLLQKHLGHLPWFSELPNAKTITLRHLLRHTSGIPRYVWKRELWRQLQREPDRRIPPAELIAMILDDKPLHESGSNFAYADTNYLLLGLVVEKLCGSSIEDFVQREFLKPHGLKNTLPTSTRKLAGLVQGHAGMSLQLGVEGRVLKDGRFVFHPGFEWCGGGYYGTTTDLARWARILWTGQAFAGDYLGELTAAFDASRIWGRGAGYGAGVIVRQGRTGKSYGHDGVFPGYQTSMAYFAERRIAAAIQINKDGERQTKVRLHTALTDIVYEAAKLFYKSEGPPLQRALDLHARTLTLDTHKDISPLLAKTAPRDPAVRDGFRLRYDPSVWGRAQVDFPKMRAGGLDCAFFIVYVGQGPLTETGFYRAKKAALAKFEAIERMAKRFPDAIEIAKTPEDVRRISARGKLVACIGIENGYAMGLDLASIAEFHARGARYMSITHNRHSQLGDSHTPSEPLHGGLSELGRKAIAEMNRVGIMVDVSHASKKTMLEAVAASKAPVLASHSACHAIYAHGRNLDDEQLRALKANGGVIQIVAFASYVRSYEQRRKALRALRADFPSGDRASPEYAKRLTAIDSRYPRATVKHLCDHIDHAVRTIGIEHVAISSDFDGGGGVDGWNNAAETFNVTLELVRRGYDDEAIGKLWSGNTLRVWQAVQDHARAGR